MTREELQKIRDAAVEAAVEVESGIISMAFLELAKQADVIDAMIARHLHEGTVEYLGEEDDDEGDDDDSDGIPQPDEDVEDMVD